MASETGSFTKVTLYTDDDGRARFRDEILPMPPAGAIGWLSQAFPAAEYQLRRSPKGFASDYHCTTRPQWVFILDGCMEIELPDGMARRFRAGESFYSADVLPDGTEFTRGVHGHRSRQVGEEELVTLFLRDQ